MRKKEKKPGKRAEKKPGKKAEPAGADTMFSVSDKLTVFGDYAVICRTFHARERFADTANGE